MKLRILAALTGAALFGPMAAQTAPVAQGNGTQAALTLDQCIEIALSESPTVKVADMEIARMDYSKKETLGQLLPNISFDGTYSRMLAKQVMYMNMDGFGGMGGDNSGEGSAESAESKPASEGIKMGLDNSFQLGFSASVPLIAPQLWQSLKLSDAQIAQTVEQARASRLNLVNSVKNAFYAYLLAEDSRRVIQESYDMAAFTHSIYVKQQSVGAASEYDVLRTSVAMKNVEPDLTQAQIAIKQARLQLLILMGLDTTAPVTFSGSLGEYEKTMYADVMALGCDYTNNTELRQNALQTQTLERALKVQKMSFIPTLALAANYNWTSMSNGSPFKNFRWNPYSTVALSLSIPLFQGGQRVNRVKQAQVQVDQMRMQREDLERSVAMQVDVARDNIQLNVKQIASSSESVGQAERAHDIMQKSFEIGAASYLDLRDSELALTQSRLAYYQTVYNYLVAGANLELLLGNAVTETPVNPYTKK